MNDYDDEQDTKIDIPNFIIKNYKFMHDLLSGNLTYFLTSEKSVNEKEREDFRKILEGLKKNKFIAELSNIIYEIYEKDGSYSSSQKKDIKKISKQKDMYYLFLKNYSIILHAKEMWDDSENHINFTVQFLENYNAFFCRFFNNSTLEVEMEEINNFKEKVLDTSMFYNSNLEKQFIKNMKLKNYKKIENILRGYRFFAKNFYENFLEIKEFRNLFICLNYLKTFIIENRVFFVNLFKEINSYNKKDVEQKFIKELEDLLIGDNEFRKTEFINILSEGDPEIQHNKLHEFIYSHIDISIHLYKNINFLAQQINEASTIENFSQNNQSKKRKCVESSSESENFKKNKLESESDVKILANSISAFFHDHIANDQGSLDLKVTIPQVIVEDNNDAYQTELENISSEYR